MWHTSVSPLYRQIRRAGWKQLARSAAESHPGVAILSIGISLCGERPMLRNSALLDRVSYSVLMRSDPE